MTESCFFEQYGLLMVRILTDKGAEYYGKAEHYLDIEHTKTKAMSPQSNGVCERFHKNHFAPVLSGHFTQTIRDRVFFLIALLYFVYFCHLTFFVLTVLNVFAFGVLFFQFFVALWFFLH
jgi:transposase InsO family protein